MAATRIATQTLGKEPMSAIQELGVWAIMTILWAGLQTHDRQLTYIDVEKLVNKEIKAKRLTMKELHTFVIGELLESNSVSGYLDDEEAEDDPLASSTGSESD